MGYRCKKNKARAGPALAYTILRVKSPTLATGGHRFIYNSSDRKRRMNRYKQMPIKVQTIEEEHSCSSDCDQRAASCPSAVAQSLSMDEGPMTQEVTV